MHPTTLTGRCLALALALMLWAPCARAHAEGGPLVLVGGSLDSPRILDEIVRLSGGAGRARIGVITAASSRAAENGAYYQDVFRRHGAADVQWIPIGQPGQDSAALLRQIRGMTGFFFGGGDQSRLLQTLVRGNGQETPAMREIRRAMERGALVGGTSAGTAVQVRGAMVTGGESYDALRRAPEDVLSPRSGGRLSYYASGGLGLFRWGALDTHFNERGRAGRLVRLAATTGQRFAFGIDEDTALVVRSPLGRDPRMSVLGQGGVSIFDLGRAKLGTGADFSIRNVRTAYLTEGDSFRPRKGKMKCARGKQTVSAPEQGRGPRLASRDIFSSRALDRRNARELVRVTTGLFDSPKTTITARVHEDPRWQVTISKTRGARCYESCNGVPRSYKNLRLDIRRGK